jgi:ADP-heptose:LPS heptosyltransferase
MRILIINLLRLGDFVQTLPVIGAIQIEHARCELDLLTFEPCRQLQPNLPGIDQWWTLNRNSLQEGLGRADIPTLTSFSLLQEKLEAINSRHYDCIINLTQTYFSAWIAGYLQTNTRMGLTMDRRGQPHFHSPWFKHLDEHPEAFHHSDVFFYGSGLKGGTRRWPLIETREGKAEAAAVSGKSRERIVVQSLTAAEKKNWPDSSWTQMVAQLQAARPQAQFVFLGAANEREAVERLVQQAQALKVDAQSAILSLSGALSLMKRSQLLITGDTSIKHLANACAIPVLELSLGPSDWRRTGPYKTNALILQPKISCAPCPHSGPCSRPQHECAQLLHPATGASAAAALLADDWNQLARLAQNSPLRFLRTHLASNGFWLAKDLQASPEVLMEDLLRRSTWKFLLNREHQQQLAKFGSEGVQLREELQKLGALNRPGLLQHLDFLEQQSATQVESTQQALRETQRAPILMASDGVTAITEKRRTTQERERASGLAEVYLKMVRSLKAQLLEVK